MRPLLSCVLAALAILGSDATAFADPTPDTILRDLAANQTHSWVDDHLTFPEMMAKYRAGERLYVTCGNVAEIGRELLREAGYPARVVQTITAEDFDYVNDGHLMLEVWLDGRWQLYDLDANVRAVDADGDGVSLIEQVAAVRAGAAQWEQIADDSLTNPAEPDPELSAIAQRIFSDTAAFYGRVMGVPLLPSAQDGTDVGQMLYHDESERSHLMSYRVGSRRFATDAEWQTLTTTPEPLPRPAAPPASATVPTATPAAVPTVVAPVLPGVATTPDHHVARPAVLTMRALRGETRRRLRSGERPAHCRLANRHGSCRAKRPHSRCTGRVSVTMNRSGAVTSVTDVSCRRDHR